MALLVVPIWTICQKRTSRNNKATSAIAPATTTHYEGDPCYAVDVVALRMHFHHATTAVLDARQTNHEMSHDTGEAQGK